MLFRLVLVLVYLLLVFFVWFSLFPVGEAESKSYKSQSVTKVAPNIFVNEPSSATSKGTQHSDPSSPYPYDVNSQNPENQNYESRFEQLESPMGDEPQKTRHVAFTTPTLANHRYFTPQSASPTNTPDPLFVRQQNGQQQGVSSEYLPPLSATPPSSADQSRNALNYNHPQLNSPQRSPRDPYHSENHSSSQSRSGSNDREQTSPNPGISDGPGLSNEEQQKLDDLLR